MECVGCDVTALQLKRHVGGICPGCSVLADVREVLHDGAEAHAVHCSVSTQRQRQRLRQETGDQLTEDF